LPAKAIGAMTAMPGATAHGHETTEGHAIVIYELRVYHCLPGRLPALLERFETVTLGYWERYGIRQAGFWTTIVGGSNHTLTYLLAWESLAERDTKWTAFANDPGWAAARAESEKDGQIVSSISNELLLPTSFSSVK
jgi:hypothetical protein